MPKELYCQKMLEILSTICVKLHSSYENDFDSVSGKENIQV